MEIENKLIALYRDGLEVWVNKNELKYRSINGIPKKEDIDFLKTNKSEIIDILNKNNALSTWLLEDDELPLTEIQSAYLLGRESHFEFGGVASHVYMEARLPLLEIKRAEKVWNNIIKEHEALHSIFTSNNTQKILKKDVYYKIEFNYGIDIKEKVNVTREKLKGKCYKPDVWPLFDISISQMDNYSLMHLSFDFLILDWTSIWILLKEFEDYYFSEKMTTKQNYNLKEIRMNQLALKQSSKYLSDKKFWEKKISVLPDAPLLPLQDNIIKNGFERMQLKVDKVTWNNIKSSIGELGFTQTSFLVTILAMVLNIWSSNSEFTLNLTTMNRAKKYLDIDIVNDFTATDLLEFKMDIQQPFYDSLKKAQEQIIEDLQHETFTGVEVTRAIRKDIKRRNSIFPFVFTSALGIKSSDYKYINLQEEGLSETPQVFMDCQAMEVNQELIINFDLRLGAFSKELSSSIVKSYFDLLNYFSNSESFKKTISDIYKENGINNTEKSFNNETLKQNNYNNDTDNDFNKIKSKIFRYSEIIQNKNAFNTEEVKDILEERDVFCNQVMLKTLIKIKGSVIFKESDFRHSLAIIDRYHWILKKWENHLEKLGFLEEKENIYVISNKGNILLEEKIDMDLLRHRWEQNIGNPEVIDYIIESSENIVNIFNGEIKPISILFPEGSSKIVESIYGNNIFCNYYNDIIKKAIDEILDSKLCKGKEIKILELGAGTGNTTKNILKMLEEKNLDCKYVFTDRALSFLSNAKNKFDDYNNVEYKQIDIDKNLAEQNLKEDDFDIVLAVGVLENSKDLEFTINNIEKVLKDNAWIIILEPITDEPWILMTQLFFMPELYRNEIYYNTPKWEEFLIGKNYNIPTKVFSVVDKKDPYTVNNIKIFICRKEKYLKNIDESSTEKNKKINNAVIGVDNNNLGVNADNIYNKKIKELCHIANKLLGNKNISPNVDLYNYGADSLLLSQLAREIIDSFNINNLAIGLKFDEVYRQLLKKPTLKNIADIIYYKNSNDKENERECAELNNCELSLFNEGHNLLRVILFDSFGTVENMKNIVDKLVEIDNATIATFSIIDVNSYCCIEDKELLLFISNMCTDFITKLNYEKIQLIGFQTGGLLAVEIATKLLKKGKSLEKTILVNSCPMQGFDLSDEIIEKEFLKKFGITNEVLSQYIDANITNYIDLQKNRDKRLKAYAQIIQKEMNMNHDSILKTFNIHEKTLKSFNTNISPYIGDVEVLLNEKCMFNYGISNEQVLKKWKDICFGIFKSNEINWISGSHQEIIEKALLTSMIR